MMRLQWLDQYFIFYDDISKGVNEKANQNILAWLGKSGVKKEKNVPGQDSEAELSTHSLVASPVLLPFLSPMNWEITEA